jgi:AAA15 family ATPase/GTPase
MEAIRIKNLRSLTDTGSIDLKNINLLVGQNSSGKSTFLRTFPLIRQSILRDTRGPILWYDETLVDFGSYEETKNRFSTSKKENGFFPNGPAYQPSAKITPTVLRPFCSSGFTS